VGIYFSVGPTLPPTMFVEGYDGLPLTFTLSGPPYGKS